MKPTLIFKIELDYNRTQYEPLEKIALRHTYDLIIKRYIWEFDMKDLSQVTTLLATPITFEDYENEIKQLISLCPALEKEVATKSYKGIGFIKIIKFPKIYLINTVINKKKQTFKIPREIVNVLWKIIQKQQMNIKVKTSTIAENLCDYTYITRFNRESGTFQFDKFFGSRKDYFHLLYYPLKVLEHYKVIIHHKAGFIERIKDNFEQQAEIQQVEK